MGSRGRSTVLHGAYSRNGPHRKIKYVFPTRKSNAPVLNSLYQNSASLPDDPLEHANRITVSGESETRNNYSTRTSPEFPGDNKTKETQRRFFFINTSCNGRGVTSVFGVSQDSTNHLHSFFDRQLNADMQQYVRPTYVLHTRMVVKNIRKAHGWNNTLQSNTPY